VSLRVRYFGWLIHRACMIEPVCDSNSSVKLYDSRGGETVHSLRSYDCKKKDDS
jgi:hypothetical protein